MQKQVKILLTLLTVLFLIISCTKNNPNNPMIINDWKNNPNHSLLKKNWYDTADINTKYNNPLSILSMGMSSDYELAIKHGSNMIRIGSSFLGYS